MRVSKQSQQFARQLFRLSLADGQVSPERVNGVLTHLTQHPPRQPLAVLRRYHRLVAVQLAKNRALVEHAGVIDAGVLRTIEATFTQKYRRPVAAAARPDPRLIAGLRIRVGDDVYESSVAAQLTALALSL
ncbi:MAG: F0F1 ATP synthase subunit delta [Opitutaceae bacterium]|nr:F0F1 ATP synthase subunit delta [Opitutaceae bacterium]